MKKSSFYIMVIGVIVMIGGCFIFPHLNYVNAVDSNRWTININGVRSFPWPVFTGFVILMIGIVFNIASWEQSEHQVH